MKQTCSDCGVLKDLSNFYGGGSWSRCISCDKAAGRLRYAKIKLSVLQHYGEKCACCGAAENLCIDHIDGTGKAHRKELGITSGGGRQFWRWLIVNLFPEGFQTLCGYCNTIKGVLAICPCKERSYA